MSAPMGLAARLWTGTEGLARTIWVYAVPSGLVLIAGFLLAIEMTQSLFIGAVGFVVVWAWQVFAGIAVWRAAGRSTGAATWSHLARWAAVGSALLLASLSAVLLGFV